LIRRSGDSLSTELKTAHLSRLLLTGWSSGFILAQKLLCPHHLQTAYSILLLQVYLQQGQGSETNAADDRAELDSERWTEIAKLLSRKHDRIDPLHALSLLPDGVCGAVAMLCSIVSQTRMTAYCRHQ